MEKVVLTDNNIIKLKAMKPDEIEAYVKMRLIDIEEKYHVTVLYAVESGSRAWGFDNEKSDYDIRFIYCGKLYNYLNIDGMTMDVIQRQENDLFDFVGWDIVKALKLMRKSNPQLIEWGEIDYRKIYVNKNRFGETLHNLSLSCWDKKTLVCHYLSMAKKDYKKCVVGKKRVDYKKYLYILREILCAGYVVENKKIPPVELSKLLEDFPYIVGKRYPLNSSSGHVYTLGEIEDFDEWNDPMSHDNFEIPYEAEKIIEGITAYRYDFKNKDNLKPKGERIKVFDDFIESETAYLTEWVDRNDKDDDPDMTDSLSRVFRNVMNMYGCVDESVYSKLR